jgi:hypothetical protein
MQVKHALIRAGEMAKIDRGLKVYDEWGHELGLDGALVDGMKIFVRENSWRETALSKNLPDGVALTTAMFAASLAISSPERFL